MHLEVKVRLKESPGRLPHSLDSATREFGEFGCHSLFVSLLHVFFPFHCSTLETPTKAQILPVLSFDYTQVASVFVHSCHLIQKFHVTVSRASSAMNKPVNVCTVLQLFFQPHTHTLSLSLFWIGKKSCHTVFLYSARNMWFKYTGSN